MIGKPQTTKQTSFGRVKQFSVTDKMDQTRGYPSRGFPPKVRTGVCLNFSVFVQICRRSRGSPVSSGAYQLNPPNM